MVTIVRYILMTLTLQAWERHFKVKFSLLVVKQLYALKCAITDKPNLLKRYFQSVSMVLAITVVNHPK